MAKRKDNAAGMDAKLAAQYRRLVARVVRVLRDVEAIRPSRLRLRCDRWGHGRVIGDLTWAAESLQVIAEHLSGRALGDDMGYWMPHNVGQAWTSEKRSRVLHEGETVLAANQAELEGVRRARKVGRGKKRTRHAE